MASLLGVNTRGITAREVWGYSTWLFFGLVFGLPESWAGAASPPWPTLSDTIGHLETLWPGTRVVVVVLIALVAYSVARYPPGHTGEFPAGRMNPGGPVPATAGSSDPPTASARCRPSSTFRWHSGW